MLQRDNQIRMRLKEKQKLNRMDEISVTNKINIVARLIKNVILLTNGAIQW